ADDGVAPNNVNLGVFWLVTSGDATVAGSPNVSFSLDPNGETRMQATAGPTPGPVVITARRSDDQAITATFHLTVVGNQSFTKTSGDGQSGLTSTPADAPLVVTLLDGNGNPVADR